MERFSYTGIGILAGKRLSSGKIASGRSACVRLRREAMRLGLIALLSIVLIPARYAVAGDPPRFGVRAGVGCDVTFAWFYTHFNDAYQVAGTLRKATGERWDFETEAIVSFDGIKTSDHRSTIERVFTVQSPLMGTYWWDSSRKGLHMSFGAQVGVLVWGWATTYYDDGDNEIELIKPRLFKRRPKLNDFTEYRFPFSVSIPFRIGYMMKTRPIEISFLAQHYIYGHQFILNPQYTGVSLTWWFQRKTPPRPQATLP